MRGSFVRSLMLATLVAVVAVTALGSNAEARTIPKTVPLFFVKAGQKASTARDTMYVQGSTDSTRTLPIDLSDADWEAITHQGSVATGYALGTITLVCEGANNGQTDTLTVSLERNSGFKTWTPPVGFAGTCVRCAKPDTTFQYENTMAGAVGQQLLGPTLRPAVTANVFSGPILILPQSLVPTNGYVGIQRVRFVIRGDQSGTTPKMSQVRGFFTYLAHTD